MDHGPQSVTFLREKELADRWSLCVKTLQRWRYRGIGVVHHKIGGRVIYKLTDVEAAENSARKCQTVLSSCGRGDE